MAEPICIIGDSITGGVVYLSDSAKYTHWKDSFVNLLGASLDTEDVYKRQVEEGAAKLGRRLEDMSLEEMEEIYQQGRHDLEGKEPVPVSHRE